MGKCKSSFKGEPASDAHQRINFLYQASMQLALHEVSAKLTSYYGYLTKEVSRKIVGKLNPRIKRSLCKACNVPLLAETDFLKPKIMGHKKQKKKKAYRQFQCGNVTPIVFQECSQLNISIGDFKERLECQKGTSLIAAPRKNVDNCFKKKSRVAARDKHPNRLSWRCPQCGYIRSILQRPSYNLWIDNDEAIDNT